MEQYVGLDVSQEQTSICVVDSGGKVIWEGKCASTPEAIVATIRARAPQVRPGTGTSCGRRACPWSASTPDMPRRRLPCS